MHLPPNLELWQGRSDPGEDLPARWHDLVREQLEDPADITLLGFASDEGVRRNQGRPGAAVGPAALRPFLANLPVHDEFTLQDLGDIVVQNQNLEEAQQEFANLAAPHLADGNLLLALGGGHEIAFASYQALRLAEPKAQIGILNLDAHFDLRESPRATSGTPFLQALTQDPQTSSYFVIGISPTANTQSLYNEAAIRNVEIIEDRQCTLVELPVAVQTLTDWLKTINHLYLTIDLDVLPASIAPGVSAPNPRGISLEFIEELLHLSEIAEKLRIADIAEYNPAFDIDHHTARVAARLAYYLVNACI